MTWDEGQIFCKHCLTCGHDQKQRVNGICLLCLRALHTLWTFDGPRIHNLAVYRLESFEDYGLRSFELLFWNFDEQELALNDVESEPVLRKAIIRKPPPHHRIAPP